MTTTTDQIIDETRAAESTGRVLGDTSATATLALTVIGDRLGLFRSLASDGPSTSAELAMRTGTQERYVREWLAGMYAAGYLTHDATDGRFTLPGEHRPTLVDEPGPAFLPGVQQELDGALARLPQIIEAFQRGGGVAHEAFPDDLHIGVDRFTAMWHQHLLTQVWVPAVPAAEALLDAGCRVADVGCGSGRALVRLAQQYPGVVGRGYDVHAPSIDRARALAAEAGLENQVQFEVLDASLGLPEKYDVITTFDVLHDAVDPQNLLRSIREALAPGGLYLCLDINCSESLDQNVGPVAALLYGFSVTYCMTTSLAHDGEGFGTLGLPPAVLDRYARAAGFTTVTKVDLDNPFKNLYVLRS
ncbi:MAG: class I SAM-dependent methyltransferase [Dermatophilaceae bacterium]